MSNFARKTKQRIIDDYLQALVIIYSRPTKFVGLAG